MPNNTIVSSHLVLATAFCIHNQAANHQQINKRQTYEKTIANHLY